MKKVISFAMVLMASFSTLTIYAQKKDIVDIAIGSEAHTTLVAAVKDADLVTVLKGDGPFTVFAPVNDAFGKLPAGTVDNLLKAENKATLAKILTYHVVAGNWDSKAPAEKIKAGNGTAELATVSGGKLWASMKGNKIVLKDEMGKWATITIKNVYQSNGVIHVIDHVIMPK